MLIGVAVAICILLAILGFLVPRLSSHARRGGNKGHSTDETARAKLPF